VSSVPQQGRSTPPHASAIKPRRVWSLFENLTGVLLASNPTFTHLINPFRAVNGSEHDVAQRMTFASIRTALDYAKKRGTEVDLVAVCYEEDVPAVEAPARVLPLLSRSVQDISPMTPVRTFPLIADLLRIAAENSTGDYLIYTNIDIILQPFFYDHVARLLRWIRGYAPAFVINRRAVSTAKDPAELPRLYAEPGKSHLGYDCFVFPRAWATEIDLGNLCIGTHLFDGVLFALLDQRSGYRMQCFSRQHLTLHMGDDGTWNTMQQYKDFNETEAKRLMAEARNKPGKPIPPWSAFAWRDLFINTGTFVGPRAPLHQKIIWRLIEETSLRQTRRLLRYYLKELPS